jgi:hypothetical protein
LRKLLIALLFLPLAACGGGGDNPAAPSPQGQNLDYDFSVPSLHYYAQDVNVLQGGFLTASLTWGNANNDLDLIWTNGSCSYDANSDSFVGVGCTGTIAESINDTTTVESISRQVTSGQTIRFWAVNFGNSAQGAHLNVRIQ